MKHEHSIRIMWYRVSCFFLLTTYSSYSQDVTEEDWIPHFGEPIANVTVPLGREAVLSCTVRNLGLFKVGWLRAEDQTVLSLDKRVVTHNSRISVSQDTDRDTWRLHIRQIRYSDRGCYMCQINTTKMKKQVGCLDVHVPPDIIDSGTSSDTVVEEGDNVTLICTAIGHPPPRIVWRREDGRSITVYNNLTGFSTVDSYNGERLDLVKVDYTQMGAYLCIATNDIPPAVSKRIVLRINFAPVARQANQMVGAVLGTTVNLVCEFHGYPNDNTSWYREIGEIHEYDGDYKVSVSRTSYQVTLHLAIRNVRAIDLGRYFCLLTNILGTSRATIQLYEIHVETTTIPTTTTTTVQPTTSPATSTTTEMPFTGVSTDRGDLEAADTNEIEEMALFNEVDSKRGAEASSRRRTYTVSSSTKMSLPIEIFSIILISLTIIR